MGEWHQLLEEGPVVAGRVLSCQYFLVGTAAPGSDSWGCPGVHGEDIHY